jgi:hypothetical protein
MRKLVIAAVAAISFASAAEAKIRIKPFIPFRLPMHHSHIIDGVPAYSAPELKAPKSDTSARTTQHDDFDIGSGQHHVDIHAGTLPITHDENAACERTFNNGVPENEPADCEMNENKSKRKAGRIWPNVSEGRRKECLGSLDDEIDISIWSDFYSCLDE